MKDCEYFHDENGNGSSCYSEQNGSAKFREEFNAWFCDHHYQKLQDIVNDEELGN